MLWGRGYKPTYALPEKHMETGDGYDEEVGGRDKEEVG